MSNSEIRPATSPHSNDVKQNQVELLGQTFNRLVKQSYGPIVTMGQYKSWLRFIANKECLDVMLTSKYRYHFYLNVIHNVQS